MRTFTNIFLLLLASLLFSSRSCNDTREERQQVSVHHTIDSLKASFSSPALSAEALHGFETSAIQKLNDFADYLNILSAGNTPPTIRMTTAGMIQNLFLSDTLTLFLDPPEPCFQKIISLKELLQTVDWNHKRCGSLVIDSVSITQRLYKVSDTSFSGSLECLLNWSGVPGSISPMQKPVRHNAEIHLKKVPKTFGSDRLEVWTVKLGSIYSMESGTGKN